MDEMEEARRYVTLTRDKDRLEAELGEVKRKRAELERVLIDAIEEERFPASARVDGMTLFLKSQKWAGPRDGDHAALVAVLHDLGMVEYLPSKVNTQSLSAFVREQEKQGDPLPPELEGAIQITERFNVGYRSA